MVPARVQTLTPKEKERRQNTDGIRAHARILEKRPTQLRDFKASSEVISLKLLDCRKRINHSSQSLPGQKTTSVI